MNVEDLGGNGLVTARVVLAFLLGCVEGYPGNHTALREKVSQWKDILRNLALLLGASVEAHLH